MLPKQIKLSEYVYDWLTELKEEKDHGSYDSVIRELILRYDYEEEAEPDNQSLP